MPRPKNDKVDFDKIYCLLDDLTERVTLLEAKPKRGESIQRVEEFNNEVAPEKEDNLRMGYADKLISITNAIKILPPNMIKEGRHNKSNVEAICGFKIDDDMMDAVYAGYAHEVI